MADCWESGLLLDGTMSEAGFAALIAIYGFSASRATLVDRSQSASEHP